MSVLARSALAATLLLAWGALAAAQTRPAIEQVAASVADSAVPSESQSSIVVRPAADGKPSSTPPPLVVFLPGTGGDPRRAATLLSVVAGQGYRAIGLAYPNVPAVQQRCPRDPDPNCAAKFREMRIWGTGASPQVANSVAESIVGRLVALIAYLDRQNPQERWRYYLTANRKPLWSRIVVSGLSQGAGMAAFIAKRERVARVICFSSPIDMLGGRDGTQLAPWLSASSATPHDRWYAVRNSREPFNPGLIKSYPALGIPADHVRVFDHDLPAGRQASDPRAYHGINVVDPGYAGEWRFLFGRAADID